MNQTAILYPVFVQVALTFVLQLFIARRLDGDARKVQRRAVFSLQIKIFDGFRNARVEVGEDVHGLCLEGSGTV